MNLDFDKARLIKKKGDYYTGDSIHLADPALHARSQDYKRNLSGRMRAVSAQDVHRIHAARGYHVSRKYDGEFSLCFFDGERLLSVNPGGTVRIGLPCFLEAERLLKASKVKSCILGCEIYMQDNSSKALRIHQVVSVLRNPKSEADMSKLGLAVFDVAEFDGEPVTTTKRSFSLAEKWFNTGKLAHVVDFAIADTTQKIMELLTDWVIGEGSEGIVLRHDTANWYKVKLRHNLDAAIIGYSEGSDERKGLLHDLLVAVVRNDGTFHELTRVGGGFTDEERQSIAANLKKRIAPSDYVAVNNDYVAYEMIKPGPVIELSCLDLITESARGGPVNRMVLKWDGKRYNALSRMPLVSVISPQFVRIRDDKEAAIDDANIRQVTEMVPVIGTDKSAEDTTSAPSQIMEREVYTKQMKGNLMVRKLLMWKTNKDEKPEFPAYVVYLTDFSPNRADPLQREIRIAETESAARKQYERMAAENFIGGWEKVGK